ncbi:hypothetical protein PCANC_02028 [Puccinia coronata f. sp. avenae]|uniref:Uncharacterized protein n=1 Tax=Puccinia coronata f. sp. avenae TaxID=200324 RepID=A0A2N5W1Y2_9BASI|nr:hypothetical protein PCANC_02028 [Puccinia coronata f. sp. avenae]
MDGICSTSKALKGSASAELPVKPPIEQDISQGMIAQQVNQILDKFIQEPRDVAPKSKWRAGLECFKMIKSYIILQTNQKVAKKIRKAGAFSIMPRIFKQRVFYAIKATDAQRAQIDQHMTQLLAGYSEFQQTFEKIHAIAEKSFPAGSSLPPPQVVEEMAKRFQWDFGVAFRESFREELVKMRNKGDFSPLDLWLGIINQVHGSMNQLDEPIPEIKQFSENE